jgi:hypothetical protein
MKTSMSGGVLGAIAAAAMLLPFAAVPAAAQTPGGSYLQSCRDVQVRGDRLTATCRTQEGRWNRTSIGGIAQCAGGVANSDGRLVCGRQGGGFNAGTQGERGREFGRHGEHQWSGREQGWRGERERGWRGEREGYGGSYGPYGPGRDGGGRWRGGPEYGWGPGYYGR